MRLIKSIAFLLGFVYGFAKQYRHDNNMLFGKDDWQTLDIGEPDTRLLELLNQEIDKMTDAREFDDVVVYTHGSASARFGITEHGEPCVFDYGDRNWKLVNIG